MKTYEVKYVDKDGCHHEYEVTAPDVRVAINNTLELCTDAKRILRCYPNQCLTTNGNYQSSPCTHKT